MSKQQSEGQSAFVRGRTNVREFLSKFDSEDLGELATFAGVATLASVIIFGGDKIPYPQWSIDAGAWATDRIDEGIIKFAGLEDAPSREFEPFAVPVEIDPGQYRMNKPFTEECQAIPIPSALLPRIC